MQVIRSRPHNHQICQALLTEWKLLSRSLPYTLHDVVMSMAECASDGADGR